MKLFDMGEKYLLPLIFLTGFVIRIYYAYYSQVQADEAYYLYDAYLHSNGLIPGVDYITRAPVLLYILSGFITIFGPDILVGRSLSLISSMITLYLTYKIGTKFYGHRVGMLAAFFFAFSPFIIWWGTPIITEPIQLMFVTAAMYMLILGIELKKTIYYFFNGIFLILAILIRQSSAIFLLIEAILLIFVIISKIKFSQIARFKFAIKKHHVVIFGFLLSIMLFTIYLSEENIYKLLRFSEYNPLQLLESEYNIYYINTIYTLGNLGISLILPTILFISITLKEFIAEKFRFWFYLYLVSFGLIFSVVLLQNSLTNELINIFLTKIIILPLFLIAVSLEAYFVCKKSKQFAFFYKIGIYICFFAYLFISFNSFTRDISIKFLPIIIIFLLAFFILFLRHSIPIEKKNDFANIFLIVWFFSIFIFYLIYSRWEIAYFYEYATVASIMSAAFLYSLYKSIPKQNKPVMYVFIILLVISTLYSPYVSDLNYNPSDEIKGNNQPMYVIKEVSKYITQNTIKDDKIFAATPIYAFQANRRVTFDIVRSYAYNDGFAESRGYPSITQLINYLKENRIKYIIIDPVYMNLYLFSKNPDLKNFVYSNYQLEKKIGTIEIFAYNTNMKEDNSNSFNINIYSDNFSTDKWKEDSYSSYGIERGTTLGIQGNKTGLYSVPKDELTYVRYRFNIAASANYVILNLTGDKEKPCIILQYGPVRITRAILKS